ncbi:MAG: hypothetical protein ACKO1Z_00320 [Actinomycetota bacterium]
MPVSVSLRSWQWIIALGLLVPVWALSAAENALEKSIFPYAIALWCGVEPAELAKLNFETQ